MPTRLKTLSLALLITLGMLATRDAFAAGIYRDGIGARSMSMGGADIAWPEDALGAMGANPANLSWLNSPSMNLGAFGAKVDGKFTNPANSNGRLDAFGGLPEFAFALPLKSCPVTLGLSFIPESAEDADWFYNDTPGGLGGATTYGPQTHKSQIVILRSALGASVKLGEQFSLGASAGLLYNENELHAPYIFQTQPTLAGAKTLLDLKTDGLGFDGEFGLLYHPNDRFQAGVLYKSGSIVHTHGDASGDVGAQLALPSVPFHYDANVVNHFPQRVSTGLSWKFVDHWRAALQVDWVNWSAAFKTLPVRLRNGDNAIINGAVGSTSLDDNVPLRWHDQVVFRGGLEYSVTDNLRLRAGYSYGQSPVPENTLTPLTAAISEHVLTAGAGYQCGRWQFDLGYQWDLPVSRTVGTSGLLSGEYNNSRVEVSTHWIGFTAGVRF